MVTYRGFELKRDPEGGWDAHLDGSVWAGASQLSRLRELLDLILRRCGAQDAAGLLELERKTGKVH